MAGGGGGGDDDATERSGTARAASSPSPSALSLLLVGAGYYSAQVIGLQFKLEGARSASLLYPSNAVLLAIFLFAPARSRLRYLGAALIGHILAYLQIMPSLGRAIVVFAISVTFGFVGS